MAFWSKFKNLFAAEKTEIGTDVHAFGKDLEPVLAQEKTLVQKDFVTPVEDVVRTDVVAPLRNVEAELKADAEKAKTDLKADLLTAIQAEKTLMKNAEGGLTAEAEAAAQRIIDVAVQVMIKDAVEHK